ncbi:hypothetical protein FO519_008542 [Halicephalobus sp. NKZ332]|nr:hypothetical protein FO519_008542 [Halicephalobus sp. NKZ332]
MHSVKKVEEKARLAREEKRKKKMFELDAVRKKVFKCFQNLPGNERTVLDLTEAILTSIPDLYSFWVMRREVLLKIKEEMEKDAEFSIFTEEEAERIWKKSEKKREEKVVPEQSEEKIPEDPEANTVNEEAKEESNENPDDVPEPEPKPKPPRPSFFYLVDQEVSLTEAALFTNPKSYSAWNHRKWAMEIHENPPLDRELQICQKALSVDCRNFHVWDYRRYIVRLLKRTFEQELEFTHDMVKKNPSNYSAWHYRINLLLELEGKISDSMFASEIRGVTENCVVNSEDQTAWTYVNWLIERRFNASEERQGVQNIVSFTDNPKYEGRNHSTFVFIDAVDAKTVENFLKNGDKVELKPRIAGSSYTKNTHAHIWDVYSDADISTTFSSGDLPEFTSSESPRRRYVNSKYLNKLYSQSLPEMSEQENEALTFFYESCVELMKENSETNPWEICAQAYVLPFLKGINREVEKEVETLLEKAKTADAQRKEMYESMKDKVVLTNLLHEKNGDGKSFLETLTEKEGIISADFTNYSVLRPLAGLIRVAEEEDKKLDPQLVWFLPATDLVFVMSRPPPGNYFGLSFFELRRTELDCEPYKKNEEGQDKDPYGNQEHDEPHLVGSTAVGRIALEGEALGALVVWTHAHPRNRYCREGTVSRTSRHLLPGRLGYFGVDYHRKK